MFSQYKIPVSIPLDKIYYSEGVFYCYLECIKAIVIAETVLLKENYKNNTVFLPT